MELVELNAEVRSETGQSAARRLRNKGLVPGVVYGRSQETVSLKLDAKELAQAQGNNAIIDLSLEDDVKKVMVKELQKDVITGEFLHVDFHQIALDEEITVEVPVTLEGTSAGQREGGVLQQALRKVEVECLPTDIPQDIKVDISHLEVGESLHAAALKTGEGVELITNGDEVVVTIVVPTELSEEDLEEETTEVVAEPEVIGEEPDEEEEEADEIEDEE
ncbi:50S ribosomal protein L25 [Selenihalanaerobacter shriftii]|uniref:Large ribosomal subunit protein bL25 n=1 Tax=Selenihalanaerobacter shriftii TaxID=142842 RepID=A0A1T4N4Y1_9FIRM|nr:50S ribosomal protein L25 [Selenihalanaerobacter shriftii]SJZ74303.1 LSU ribosomal protein L25P [Selenihalanaerobacter shriftii]